MAEPLTLHQLSEKQRMFDRIMPEHRPEIDELRKRIEAGYEKIAASGFATDDPRVVKAQATIADLEGLLVKKERAVEIPWYVHGLLIQFMRDALRWHGVPEGSRARVMIPGVLDLTVKLDMNDEEVPF